MRAMSSSPIPCLPTGRPVRRRRWFANKLWIKTRTLCLAIRLSWQKTPSKSLVMFEFRAVARLSCAAPLVCELSYRNGIPTKLRKLKLLFLNEMERQRRGKPVSPFPHLFRHPRWAPRTHLTRVVCYIIQSDTPKPSLP